LFNPPAPARRAFRILALDVDGTLLDSQGELRPSTAAAVRRAARAGARPVLCTGRRYRRAIPISEQLGLDAPLVCNSGALVKDPSTHRTLWRRDLGRSLVTEILAIFRDRGEPAVSFTDRPPAESDFLIPRHPTGRAFFDEYVDLNRPHAEIDPQWANGTSAGPHFHVCAVGSRDEMLALEAVVHATLPLRVRTFVQKSPKYSGTMCEILHPDASKWSAVLHLAHQWGVDPSEICAVGDDMNDLPMISAAGFGVAMAHAPAAVREAADWVASHHDEDGLAQFITDVLGI
jgi:5-amino-6-(5-phospho-D-ribitylamino)uracil phosphatase